MWQTPWDGHTTKPGGMRKRSANSIDALRITSDNATCHYHLGVVYTASGQPSLAQKSLEQALKSNPNFPYADLARAALSKFSKDGGPNSLAR